MHQPPIAVFSKADIKSDEPGLPAWERVMHAAADASRTSRFRVALAGYKQALDIARRLIARPPENRENDCVAALVVSYLNLADLELDLQRDDDDSRDHAAAHLCAAHETLLALLLDTARHSARHSALRQAALRHSRETHVALLSHIAAHGSHPLITRTLESGERAITTGGRLQH